MEYIALPEYEKQMRKQYRLAGILTEDEDHNAPGKNGKH